ncbi:MAG: AbrB/MazE/SpoVT family DNA-binding domain-containing protein, partial [Alphaproteobacteria bacterium]|nr:AbrB/MazE/SpoVT family DNA-binding domain-containing protein [Alphaproteobacteria bacterium]
TPDGFRITPHDPGVERQIGLARKLMKKHRKALRELAR